MRRALSFGFVLGIGATACASKPAVQPQAPLQPAATITSAGRSASPATTNLGVSEDLARACNLHFGSIDRAPKFDFDQSDLLPEDTSVLAQIAKCVTDGPLKGRALRLVGRADPRGESEYNMVLGEHRASSVHRYLVSLGVASDKVAETSRGELDASGRDETGWRRDRRVDVELR